MSNAPAPCANHSSSASLGRSGLRSSTSSNAPSTTSSTSRVANSVFATSMGQLKRTQRLHPLAMGADDNGDGLTGGPRDEMMRFLFSEEEAEEDRVSTAAAAKAKEQVPLKRSLGESDKGQQSEPAHNKRQRCESGARVCMVQDNVAPSLHFVAPSLTSPQQQQQQQQRRARKHAQMAIAPYQVTSAAGGGGEQRRERDSTWEGFDGGDSSRLGKGGGGGAVSNSSEEEWAGNVSPSLTTTGHVVGGGALPLLSSSSSSSGGLMAPTSERSPEVIRPAPFRAGTERTQGGVGIGERYTGPAVTAEVSTPVLPRIPAWLTLNRGNINAQEPRSVSRPALRADVSDGVPNNPSSGGFNEKSVAEVWEYIVDNWRATVAAATYATCAEQQPQLAMTPCEAFAKKSLEAALKDQGDKLSVLQASIAVALDASQRFAAAASLLRDTNERLRTCRSQCLQPAKRELERCLRDWDTCLGDMRFAMENAKRTEELARNAEKCYSSLHQSAVLAREKHQAAWSSLRSTPPACKDFGDLVAAEHRAREAHGRAIGILEHGRRKATETRATAITAANLVDVEAAKRFFLDDDVEDAKRQYGEARETLASLAAQLRNTADKNRVASMENKAACIVYARAQTEYDVSKNRTKRTLGTYGLFVLGRKGGRAAGRSGGGGGDARVDARGGGRAAGEQVEALRLGKRNRETGASGILPSAPGTTHREGSATGRVGGAGEDGNNEGEPALKRTRLGTLGQER